MGKLRIVGYIILAYVLAVLITVHIPVARMANADSGWALVVLAIILTVESLARRHTHG